MTWARRVELTTADIQDEQWNGPVAQVDGVKQEAPRLAARESGSAGPLKLGPPPAFCLFTVSLTCGP